jgi:hypothetical protein
MDPLLRLLPGLLISGALAAFAMALGRIGWLQDHGFSALTLAIVLGMLVGNTVYPRVASMSGAGVNFSKQNLLRLGVVLYGLRLTVQAGHRPRRPGGCGHRCVGAGFDLCAGMRHRHPLARHGPQDGDVDWCRQLDLWRCCRDGR